MTWTIHIAFSWSWWSFAAGIPVGGLLMLLGIAYSVKSYGGFNP